MNLVGLSPPNPLFQKWVRNGGPLHCPMYNPSCSSATERPVLQLRFTTMLFSVLKPGLSRSAMKPQIYFRGCHGEPFTSPGLT